MVQICSDVNKATGYKAKARDLKAKPKDFQHIPRLRPGMFKAKDTLLPYETK